MHGGRLPSCGCCCAILHSRAIPCRKATCSCCCCSMPALRACCSPTCRRAGAIRCDEALRASHFVCQNVSIRADHITSPRLSFCTLILHSLVLLADPDSCCAISCLSPRAGPARHGKHIISVQPADNSQLAVCQCRDCEQPPTIIARLQPGSRTWSDYACAAIMQRWPKTLHLADGGQLAVCQSRDCGESLDWPVNEGFLPAEVMGPNPHNPGLPW